jgi:GH15 family glucan-1,4-alpha-glucosidase
LDSPEWEIKAGYENETLVTKCQAINQSLNVKLLINDAVHFREDIYLKKLTVINESDCGRRILIFFTHDFSIDETDIGDTALYDLSTDCIMHYKRDKAFLISGHVDSTGIYEYATGVKRFGGAEGTWRDAEDGHLEGNPISQGSVDSTISFQMNLPAHGETSLEYWIVVGNGFEPVRNLHALVRTKGLSALLEETRSYWQSWVNKENNNFLDLNQDIVRLYKLSLLIGRTQIDRRGAVIAATDTDILQFNRDHYSYMWPRDGALVAYAYDLAGYSEVTRPFFQFCSRLLSPGGFLWHKYNPDGSVGSSWHPWLRNGETQLPIQEDETALVLFALERHYLEVNDIEFVEAMYKPLIRPAADFIAGYRDSRNGLPLDSFDLWEERRGVFTFTCCAVWAGLKAAARFAKLFGHKNRAEKYHKAAGEVYQGIVDLLYCPELGRFVRGFYMKDDGSIILDKTIESSLFSLFAFGLFSPCDYRVTATMKAIEERLWIKPIGGIARYDRDYYFHKTGDFNKVPGNPWIISTLWLAGWYIDVAKTTEDLKKVKEIFQWVADRALPSGVLSEQVHPETGQPVSVAPLTWSHATYVLMVCKYLKKLRSLEKNKAVAANWLMHTL